MASQTLSDRLRAAVESRHCLHHPYYELWRKGTLSRPLPAARCPPVVMIHGVHVRRDCNSRALGFDALSG